MADKPKKGVAADTDTGPATRRAIAAARRKGSTTEDIARAAKRSESVINAIESGDIKRPPANLAGLIRQARSSK